MGREPRMPVMFTSIGLVACLLLGHAISEILPTVTVDAGVLVGTSTLLPTATAVVNKFLGIPFAKSPPGRFMPPVREHPYGSPRNASAFSPACYQSINNVVTQSLFNNPAPTESEDCLYLNVFAPSTPVHPDNQRAVLFWIYGGSLQFGNAGQPAYDGSRFAAYEDVVVVTVNYRTNVFGFPIAPDQPVDARNLGFLDQRAALAWVTLFGESAGAFSIDALLTSYPRHCKPPFRAAILQSGQYGYRRPSRTGLYDAWNSLASSLNCSGSQSNIFACVKRVPAEQIRAIVSKHSLSFNPVAENVTLVRNPAKARRSGNIARVPVLVGTNAQEGRIFELGQSNITAAISSLITTNEADIRKIAAMYPLGENGLQTPYDVISQIFTEWIFQCPQAAMANDSAFAGIPTWRYYFNATFSNTQGYPHLGVFHSSEIPIVFRTYSLLLGAANTTTQQYALSQYMQQIWAKFAKDPQGGPGWNAVDVGVAAQVLAGSRGTVIGGLYTDAKGDRTKGDFNLAVLGNVGSVLSSGATIVEQSSLDQRCVLYEGFFDSIRGGASAV